jgi:hypothetical protein
VDIYAGKLESCFCDEQIRVERTTNKRKQAILKVSTGKPSCIWQGRTATCFVAVGRSQLYHHIEIHSTVDWQERLVLLCETDRLTLVLGQQQLRIELLEELKFKLACCDHLPWSMCGVFYGCCGRDVETSLRILQPAINEFDHAVVADNASERRLHMVERRMLSQTTICRAALSEFLLICRLGDYAVAFAISQEYAFVSLVEWRVEADGYRRCAAKKLRVWFLICCSFKFNNVHMIFQISINKIIYASGPSIMCSHCVCSCVCNCVFLVHRNVPHVLIRLYNPKLCLYFLCFIVQNIFQIVNYITTISQTTTTFKLQFVYTIRKKY